jgi:RNA polymerase sigma-70 factor, ECF subfamily
VVYADDPNQDLTAALTALSDGQPGAVSRVLPLLYERLRALAHHQLQTEECGHTLQPTALLHEAYLRLIDQRQVRWRSSAQFFAIASQAMRRILIDHARARHAQKRGGARDRVSLASAELILANRPEVDLLALDEALTRLGTDDSMAAHIVEMRFFGGMEFQEIAGVLGVTDRTVRRHWLYAKAWLTRELLREPHGCEQ